MKRGIARGGLPGGGGGGLRAVGSGGRRGAAAFVGAGEEVGIRFCFGTKGIRIKRPFTLTKKKRTRLQFGFGNILRELCSGLANS